MDSAIAIASELPKIVENVVDQVEEIVEVVDKVIEKVETAKKVEKVVCRCFKLF